MPASRYWAPDGAALLGGGPLGLGCGVAVLGDGAGDVGGREVGVLVGGRLGDGDRVVLLGAGAGLSWVQATGPIIHAATKTAVRTGRRMLLLSFGPPPGA